MNLEETVAELRAIGDVIDAISESSESLEFADTVTVGDELGRVKKRIEDALGLLTTRQLQTLEGVQAQVYGNRVFARRKKYADRFDHEAIIGVAIEQGVEAATDLDSGAIDPRQAAEAAARAMHKLYLSPSTKAKVSVLEALDVKVSDVRSREFKGYEVNVTELALGDDDDD